jgi:hypothetical protein
MEALVQGEKKHASLLLPAWKLLISCRVR